ncbi:MAG: pantoate--beta-alanine ligase [Lachnospiraceae bacterium]
MKIAVTIKEVREQVNEWRKQGLSIGLVPTMGYLHEGHKSLITCSVSENDRTVASVFVNPMQFGPSEDLESYPRDMDRDAALCEEAGVDLIFHPEPSEMYHNGFSSYVDMDTLTGGLCGKSRPVHFRGVCTVVAKLFNIVMPDRAYFGQKDAQQLAVIQHMADDLSYGIEIKGCPIVREADGLAKSSRNTYLNKEERQAALVLNKALSEGKKLIEAGERNASKIKDTVTEIINAEPMAKIDYVEVVNWSLLEPVDNIDGTVLVAVAVFIGKTRLIDNFIVKADDRGRVYVS